MEAYRKRRAGSGCNSLLSAANEQEIEAAFATFVQLRPGALLVDSDLFFNTRREQIVALAARYKVPAIYECANTSPPGA